MKLNGKNGLALLLIACGVLILLGKFGLGFGSLFGILFGLALVGLGFIGLNSGRKWLGIILMAVGALIVMSKITGLIGWIVAFVMIAIGVSMFKKSKVY